MRKRGLDPCEGQAECRAHARGVGRLGRVGVDGFQCEAALVPRIFGLVVGAPRIGVVGRRPRPQKRETVGVVVRVEQIGQLVGGVGHAERVSHAEHHQAVEPGGQRAGGHRDAQGHAYLLGGVEVDHPVHAGVDGQSSAGLDRGFGGRIGRGRLRVGADGERPAYVLPGDGRDHLATRVQHGDPAVGQQPRLRRMAPAGVLARQGEGREGGCNGRGLIGRRGRGGPLGRVGGPQRARDPGCARCAEAVCQLAPCVGARGHVVPRPPILKPVVLAPGLLIGSEVGLVAVEVDLVGVHAHAQFGVAVGLRKKARLEPHRQQHQRQVAAA